MLKPRPIKKAHGPRSAARVKPANQQLFANSRFPSQKEAVMRTPEATSFLEVTPLFKNGTAGGSEQFQAKRPSSLKPFRCGEVQKAAELVMEDFLQDKLYERQQCNHFSQLISSKILEKIQELGYNRYKMVAIVSIGSMKERPGMQFGSRCLWNKETDNFISAKYSNSSVFAVAMVYGLCFD